MKTIHKIALTMNQIKMMEKQELPQEFKNVLDNCKICLQEILDNNK